MTKRRARPQLLDLFCGAGMGSDGYVAAGFDVTGVDVNPQPCYPYEFIQADALELFATVRPGQYDVIHASPPCQAFTRAAHLRTAQGGVSKYADLLTPMLEMLRAQGTPWIVENVPGAPGMDGAIRECGSSYGLQVQRHRLFLSSVPITGSVCNHRSFPLDPITGKPRPWGVFHVAGDNIPKGGRTARDAAHGREVMGVSRDIPWNSLKEGFPPAYSQHVGEQVREFLGI